MLDEGETGHAETAWMDGDPHLRAEKEQQALDKESTDATDLAEGLCRGMPLALNLSHAIMS